MDATDESRLDKWLWTARFFKTRSLAAEAIEGGKVEVNDEKPKRAKTIRPGDRIRIRLGPTEYRVTVTAIARQRGSAAIAAGLYQEDPASRADRERAAEQHRLAARLYGEMPTERPTKKARRDLDRWKRG
jgi:ribosome-associated heat shock protein Hsp15